MEEQKVKRCNYWYESTASQELKQLFGNVQTQSAVKFPSQARQKITIAISN
jgi:hypothetical protein